MGATNERQIMGIVIGGEKAWKTYRHGDIGVAYHWVNGEPAMVLFPATRNTGGSFAICLSSAHLYAESNGYATRHAAGKAYEAAEVLGIGFERATIFRLISAILDGIPDLVAMPPERVDRDTSDAIGEMRVLVDGEVISERVVTEAGIR